MDDKCTESNTAHHGNDFGPDRKHTTVQSLAGLLEGSRGPGYTAGRPGHGIKRRVGHPWVILPAHARTAANPIFPAIFGCCHVYHSPFHRFEARGPGNPGTGARHGHKSTKRRFSRTYRDFIPVRRLAPALVSLTRARRIENLDGESRTPLVDMMCLTAVGSRDGGGKSRFELVWQQNFPPKRQLGEI